MTAPGWYEDYEGSGQLRYHDGEQWTEHLHAAHGAEVAPSGGHEPEISAMGDGPIARLFSLGILGVFVGVMFGGFLFNAAGTLTSTTEEAGTVERIDIEYSADRNRPIADNTRYVLEGSTESGIEWRIVSEEAYRQLEREGYPQQVTVAIGDWTGVAERVTGESWIVDHQTTNGRIGYGIVLALIGLGVLWGAWLAFRWDKGGPGAAAAFLFSVLVVGNWLGWIMFRWIQSG